MATKLASVVDEIDVAVLIVAPSVSTENDIDHWVKQQVVMAYAGSCSLRLVSVGLGLSSGSCHVV